MLNSMEEMTHPDPQMIIDKIFEFHRKYWNMWIPIDAANQWLYNVIKDCIW